MTFSLQYVRQEILQYAEEAYRQALAVVSGDVTAGTIKQKWTLLHRAKTMANTIDNPDEKERYLDIWMQCFDSIRESIENSKNEEDKEWYTNLSGECATFARKGMIDRAIAVAKWSREPGQYNAAENLTNIARFVANEEGFDKAVPIIDEAVAAAKRLPRLFWSEREIVSAARLYMEAGRTQTAKELIAPLSAGGRLSGLLMKLDVLLERQRDRERYPEILKQCEAIAAEIKDEEGDRAQAFISIAKRYVMCGLPDEGEQLVELKAQDANPREIALFRWELANYLWQNGRKEDAEKQVDRIIGPYDSCLMVDILEHEKDTADKTEFRRLIAKAESLAQKIDQKDTWSINNLCRIAAYKIKVGDVTEGRRMVNELIATAPLRDREYVIERATYGLSRAALYDEAVDMIETMDSPWRKIGMYEMLEWHYLEREDPETNKKRNWHRILKET